MLNTQLTSCLRVGRQETSSERARETKEESLLQKSGKTAKSSPGNRCTQSRVWIEFKKESVLCSSTDSSCKGIWSPLDKEKREKSEISANPHSEVEFGHFKSKFNNRTPLSLHPPVPMVTDNLGLFPNTEGMSPEATRRIVRNLEKIRFERNKTGIEKYVFQRDGNETKGEKTIKLAREKNTLPEVIIRHRLHEGEKRHFSHRLNEKFWSAPPSSMDRPIYSDKTIPIGNQDARNPFTTNRSVLAWSACVVPATLVDFPARKRSTLMTSLKRPRKRVQNNMADSLRGTGKPAAYKEQNAQVLPRTSAGNPLSRLLYPSHHGY